MKICAILLMLTVPCAAACAQTPAAKPALAAAPHHLQDVLALRDAGRIPEAVAKADKMGIHMTPDGVQLWYYAHAVKQQQAGHLLSVIAAFRDGAKCAPHGAMSGTMHYELAALFYNKSRYAEAVPELQAATHFADQDNAWTWLLLGTSLHKLGRDAEARTAWQQATVAADPWHTDSQQAARNELKHLRTRSHE